MTPIETINLTNISFAPEEIQLILSDINSLITIFQAIGGVFVLWIILSLIRMYFLRKRTKTIEQIGRDVRELKRDIEKLKNRKK